MEEKTTKIHCTTDAFHCDFQRKLCIGHLGNNLLNAAEIHAAQRQFGMNTLKDVNKTWVLSRFALEMDSIPVEGDNLIIETWLEGAVRYFTRRNWDILGVDGKVYGHAKSIWAMMDTNTRQPYDISLYNDNMVSAHILPEKHCEIADVSRVSAPLMTEYSEFVVAYSDIDVNGHCNSMRYIDHVMNTFNRSHFEKFQLKRLDIAYTSEGYWGETIRIYHTSEDSSLHYFRLTKQGADNKEVELCRLKCLFEEK